MKRSLVKSNTVFSLVVLWSLGYTILFIYISIASSLKDQFSFSPLSSNDHNIPYVDPDPIDFVYTWVNGSDPEWIKTRSTYLRSLLISPRHPGSVRRFRDYGSLYFSIKLSYMFAPWVRRIFIVTADKQVPTWFNKHEFPNVEFIFHSSLFQNPSHLPTYNSNAVESHIHEIPGLAEKYVYLNDDMLLTRPWSREDAFPGGRPAYQYDPKLSLSDKELCKMNQFTCGHVKARDVLSNAGLLREDFDTLKVIAHSGHPFIKSEVIALQKVFPEIYEKTSSMHFRESYVRLTPLYYQSSISTSVKVVADYRWFFVKLPLEDFRKRVDQLYTRPRQWSVAQDGIKGSSSETNDLLEEFDVAMQDFLEYVECNIDYLNAKHSEKRKYPWSKYL